MDTYISVKKIQAEPMSADAAVKKGYKTNNHTGDGYEIIYPDGYKAWCPKDIFEKYYFLIENPERITEMDAQKYLKQIGYNPQDPDEEAETLRITYQGLGFALRWGDKGLVN